MPHPKQTKREGGKLWHLEDTVKMKSHAEGLAQHLKHTEDKKAKIIPTKDGYQVWWATNHGG
jgi:hypothetical protein